MLPRNFQYFNRHDPSRRSTVHTQIDGSVAPSKLALLAVAILVVFICYLRLAPRLQFGFLWGEDGPVFLKAAYEHGRASLLEPYAGYFHFDARLVTYVMAKMAPLPAMPYLLPWVCVGIYALIAMYLYAASLRLIGSTWQRPLVAGVMALAPFLVPQTGEVYLSVTNLQWILAPAMLACICELVSPHIADHLSRRQLLLRALFLFTGSMTGPFGPIFLIVAVCALGMTWRAPRGFDLWASLGAFALGAAIQGTAIAILSSKGNAAPPEMLKGFPWVSEFLNYFIAELFYPGELEHHRPGIASAAIAFLALTFVCMAAPRRPYKLALLFLAVMLWYVGVQRSGTADMHVTWTGYGSRYLFVPHILIVWACSITLASSPRKWIKTIAAVGILFIFAASLQRFQTLIWNDQHWTIQRSAQDVFEVHLAPGWNVSIKDNLHHGL